MLKSRSSSRNSQQLNITTATTPPDSQGINTNTHFTNSSSESIVSSSSLSRPRPPRSSNRHSPSTSRPLPLPPPSPVASTSRSPYPYTKEPSTTRDPRPPDSPTNWSSSSRNNSPARPIPHLAQELIQNRSATPPQDRAPRSPTAMKLSRSTSTSQSARAPSSPSSLRASSPLPPIPVIPPRTTSVQPGIASLHEPPVLLPPSSSTIASSSEHSPHRSSHGHHRRSSQQQQKQQLRSKSNDDLARSYHSDGQFSIGDSSTDEVLTETSEDDEWTGVDLTDEEDLPRVSNSQNIVQRHLDFRAKSASRNRHKRVSDTMEELQSDLVVDKTTAPHPSQPFSSASTSAPPDSSSDPNVPTRSHGASPKRLSRSSVSPSGRMAEEEAGENAWWANSSGSINALDDMPESQKAIVRSQASTELAEAGAGDMTVRLTQSKVGLAFDYNQEAGETERSLDSQPAQGRATTSYRADHRGSILPLLAHDGLTSTTAASEDSPIQNGSSTAASVDSHTSSSSFGVAAPQSRSTQSTTPSDLLPQRVSTPPATASSMQAAPSLPPVFSTTTSSSDEELDLADAMALSLAQSTRRHLSPRSSSRGALDRDAETSSISSHYSNLSSGLGSPRGEYLRPLQFPEPSSSSSHATEEDGASTSNNGDSLAGTPPVSSELAPALELTVSSPNMTPTSPERSGKRRELKPERKAPVLSQKSIHRVPGSGRKSVSESTATPPSKLREENGKPETENEAPPTLDTVAALAIATAGTNSTEQSPLLPRGRDSSRMSSSDFADVYGSFSHPASDQDPDSPLHSRPISTIAEGLASLSSPPLPPIPFDSPSPESYSTPPLAAEQARFPSPFDNTRLGATAVEGTRRSLIQSDDDSDYHDASMSRNGSADQAPPRSGSSLRVEITSGGENSNVAEANSPTNTGAPKADARARALAFVADLKKAKLAQASSDGGSPASSLPVSPVVPSEAVMVPLPPETPEPMVEDVDPIAGHFHEREREREATVTEAYPPPTTVIAPSTPEQSPHKTPLAGSFANTASRPPLSPTLTNRSFESQAQSFQTLAVADLDKLTRRRPLPECMQYRDVRMLRTPGERARRYAEKINALAREESGLDTWMTCIRGPQSPAASRGIISPTGSPSKTRHGRDDTTATFPARGDGFRAREIHQGAFGARDMTPTVPYPGVLHLARGTKSSSASKSSFFSLGRKGSKRMDAPQRSFLGASSITAPLGGVLGVSGLPPTMNASVAPSLGRATGPRMPASPRANSTHSRASSFSLHSGPPLNSATAASPEAVSRLMDILPNADKGSLARCLVQAGNDETLALGMYIAETQGQSARR
ncbi:hypothetical protein T439DRAFT_323790 [Meredithblackwellia eburnea MCA 4105]